MKILRNAAFGLCSLLALILLSGLFISKDLNYEKSIVLDAPIEKVWPLVSTLEAMDKWSPWNDYDPAMKKQYSGTSGAVGSSVSWSSAVEQVGNGSQTIIEVKPMSMLVTHLKFSGEFESEAKGLVKTVSQGSKTQVTWGFESEMPYPMNIIKLFMSPESMMGNDFANGLNKLKQLAE